MFMEITCQLFITPQKESTLKEKCHVNANHAVRESAKMGEKLTGCIRLTKVVNGHTHNYCVTLVLYDIYDGVTYQ